MLVEEDDSLPFVHAIENPDGTRSPSVCIDNVKASETMIEYLISLGHRKIGVVAGQRDSEITRRRAKGYFNAMKRSGLEASESDIVYGEYSLESGATNSMKLLNRNRKLTALFCMSDEIAIGAMSTARALEINLPDELSITGFDNIEYGKYCHPTLTTVTQPAEMIGEVAVELMCERLSGQSDAPSHQVLPTELVVRQSATLLKRD
jgi:LacI family repressor for deo operon, udp, cdd, tsx, nupC, and nupG